MNKVRIGNRWVGEGEPTYIIAEIGSNFDGSLAQAKMLIALSKEVGADAAKFQSFLPDKIIAEKEFQTKVSFQSKWEKSVYQVYSEAVLPREWQIKLARDCKKVGIDFLVSPYDMEAVDLLDSIGVCAYKIGSGDITYLTLVEYIAKKGKPIILATGASSIGEVEKAVDIIRGAGNEDIILLQCVTSYPSPVEQANIKVMATLRQHFCVPVGYSDHSKGNVVALGAVALGACVIEKHFTFDKTKEGPDHSFAMDVPEMASLVRDIRLLESALGSPVKHMTSTEEETVIIQRRSIFAKVDIPANSVITTGMIECLRPAIGITPEYTSAVLGKRTMTNIKSGEPITWDKIGNIEGGLWNGYC